MVSVDCSLLWGIRLIGAKAGRTIAEHFPTMEALQAATVETLTAVSEIGPTMADSLVAYFKEPYNLELIAALREVGVVMAEEQVETERHRTGRGKPLF